MALVKSCGEKHPHCRKCRPDVAARIGATHRKIKHLRRRPSNFIDEGWFIYGDRYVVRIISGGLVNHARAVWTQAYGVIPKGKLIHHKDIDSFNDSPENLQAMTNSEHMKLHRMEVAA